MFVCGSVLLVGFVGLLVSQHHRFDVDLSHRALVRMYMATRANDGDRLVYVGQRPISAEFYAAGKAVKVDDTRALAVYRASPNADYFAVRARDFDAWSSDDRAGLQLLGKFGEYRLLREISR